MTLCPIALAVTCRKCPAFSFCPLKTVIGDETAGPPTKSAGTSTRSGKGSKKS